MEMIELYVPMCCNGCERTIRKALSKIKGIDFVDVDLAGFKVTVTGYVDRKKVLNAVRRTGKRAEFWAQQNHNRMKLSTAYMSNPSQAFARTYNYEKHGYNENNGYPSFDAFHHDDNDASTMFSDENAHACAIM